MASRNLFVVFQFVLCLLSVLGFPPACLFLVSSSSLSLPHTHTHITFTRFFVRTKTQRPSLPLHSPNTHPKFGTSKEKIKEKKTTKRPGYDGMAPGWDGLGSEIGMANGYILLYARNARTQRNGRTLRTPFYT